MAITRNMPPGARIEKRPVYQGSGANRVQVGEREVVRARFTWEGPDGTPRREQFDVPEVYSTRKADIQRFIDQRKEAIRQGTFGRAVFPTFAEWVPDFMRLYAGTKNKSGTIKEKESMLKNHLLPFFGRYRLDARELKTEHVQGFIAAKQADPQGAKFINNLLTTLATILRVAVDYGKSDLVVVTRKTASGELAGKLVIQKLRVAETYQKPITEDEFFTRTELAALIQCARARAETFPGERWVYNAIVFLVNTGLRSGELRAVHMRDDIDVPGAKVVVSRAFSDGQYVDSSTTIAEALAAEETPKGVRSRLIGLNLDAIAAVRDQAHLRGPYLFCQDNGSPLSRNDLSVAVRRVCRDAGVKELGPHGLRHTFASHFLMRGGKLPELKQLLGHVDLKTTMRYAHLEVTSTVRAVDVLNGLGNG